MIGKLEGQKRLLDSSRRSGEITVRISVQGAFEYCLAQGIKLCFTHSGKPMDNSFIESLNGKFRDECLREWLLDSTFVRSLKMNLFGIQESESFSKKLIQSSNFHACLLKIYFLKFGVLGIHMMNLKHWLKNRI